MHTFTLLDADGASHDYEILVLHSGSEGQPIALALYALIAEPVAGIVGGGVEAGGGLASLLDEGSVVGIDWSAVGVAIRAALTSPQVPKLITAILAHTTRDGARLSDRLAFDTAYRGNYLELFRAVWEVVKHNRFLPLSAISALAEKAKAAKAAKQVAATP